MSLTLAATNNIRYSYYKYYGQGHKVIDTGLIWKGFVSWDKIHLSLTLQKLRLKCCGHRQTGQKFDSPNEPFR